MSNVCDSAGTSMRRCSNGGELLSAIRHCLQQQHTVMIIPLVRKITALDFECREARRVLGLFQSGS